MPELGVVDESSLKPHFVLVHGISGGSWCWYKIRCLMENSGCKVSCIDLKSAGIDRSDADSVLTFDDYNEPLAKFMSALPEKEQVILYSKIRTMQIRAIELKAWFLNLTGDFSGAQCRRAECNLGNS